jgi:2-dehydropantoate 2-reductase
MRILILGAGATGGYFGGRFAQAGADVTFLVRPARAETLRAEGLRITSPFGDVALAPQVVTAEAVRPTYDLVILSCKAWDLEESVAAIAPAMANEARVLPLLNGLRHLDVLDAEFGAERVVGGMCYIAATLARDGVVRHLNRIHGFVFGPRSPVQEPFCEALLAALRTATADVRLSAIIMTEMWEKWISIAALAGATCLMRAAVGDIVAAPGGEALVDGLLGEASAVAAAAGHPPRPKPIARFRELLTEPGSTFTASMLRDIETGGRIETDHLLGDLVARARAGGLPTPLLDLAFCHLKAYEARRAREAAGRT